MAIDGQQIRIAVAEDEPDVRSTFVRLLEVLGYKVVCAVGNGEELIEQCVQLEVDLAFVDLDMPVIDGLAAAEIISEKGIPVILVSGHPDARQVVLEARARGCPHHQAGENRRIAAGDPDCAQAASRGRNRPSHCSALGLPVSIAEFGSRRCILTTAAITALQLRGSHERLVLSIPRWLARTAKSDCDCTDVPVFGGKRMRDRLAYDSPWEIFRSRVRPC